MDISSARDELASLSGTDSVSAVAVRFSAAMCCAKADEFQSVFALDPVLSGTAYASELEAVQRATLNRHQKLPDSELEQLAETDFLGTDVAANTIYTSIEAIDGDAARLQQTFTSEGVTGGDTWAESALGVLLWHDVIQSVVDGVSNAA